MIEMDQAWVTIYDKTTDLAKQKAENTCLKYLDQIVPGDVLAEEVHAVDDLPPFRASVMDGYAISKADEKVFNIISYKSLAGSNPSHSIEETKSDVSYAIYVTTGAPVPDGCTAVVPIENIEKLENN